MYSAGRGALLVAAGWLSSQSTTDLASSGTVFDFPCFWIDILLLNQKHPTSLRQTWEFSLSFCLSISAVVMCVWKFCPEISRPQLREALDLKTCGGGKKPHKISASLQNRRKQKRIAIWILKDTEQLLEQSKVNCSCFLDRSRHNAAAAEN